MHIIFSKLMKGLTDTMLIRIALIASLIGIVGLYFISGRIEITDKTAAKINSVDIEKVVTITGKVKNIRTGTDFSVITVEKSELVKVAVFENISSSDIKQGKNIQVKGKVKEYQGDYEIVADEIRIK
jgi:DNA/RNA endonuclease YhcR with UshA esterase domain